MSKYTSLLKVLMCECEMNIKKKEQREKDILFDIPLP